MPSNTRVPWAHLSKSLNSISIVLAGLTLVTNRHRQTDRETDHATPYIAIAHVLRNAMRPNNNNKLYSPNHGNSKDRQTDIYKENKHEIRYSMVLTRCLTTTHCKLARNLLCLLIIMSAISDGPV